MRKILINKKNEFGFFGVKISKSNQGAKMLGSLFEANDNKNSRSNVVIVSNKANSVDAKKLRG